MKESFRPIVFAIVLAVVFVSGLVTGRLLAGSDLPVTLAWDVGAAHRSGANTSEPAFRSGIPSVRVDPPAAQSWRNEVVGER